MDKEYFLLEDVRSFMNRDSIPWGKQGEKVRVVDDRGNVLIVESINGERFPVTHKQVIESGNEIERPPDVLPLPQKVQSEPKRKQKAVPINQQNLF